MKNFIQTPQGQINEVNEVLNIEDAVTIINEASNYLEASRSGKVIEIENNYDLTNEEIQADKDIINSIYDSWLDNFNFNFILKFNC